MQNKKKFQIILGIAAIVLSAFILNVYAVNYFSITVSTQGQGYVSSYPSGILCGAACQESYNSGTQITLTAMPNEGSTFQSWTGACNGAQTTCTIVLSESKEVTAIFSGQNSNEYELVVYRTGGLGRITSNPVGIYCGSICTYDSVKFPADSTVTLTAEATGPGIEFIRWDGTCTGTEKTCTITMDARKTVTGIFTGGTTIQQQTENENNQTIQISSRPNPQPIIEVQIIPKTYDLIIKIDGAGNNGIGKGKVSALDYNIDCSQSCTKKIGERELVTLTATPEPGSIFIRWNEYCQGTQANCTLSFNSQKNVSALFEKSSTLNTNPEIKTETETGYLRSGKITAEPKKKTHQVWVYVTGKGTVQSQNQEIQCTENGENCAAEFEKGSSVTLTAEPDIGNRVVRWEGACQDPANGCIFTVDKLQNVWVSFMPVYYGVSVNKTGTGSGKIQSSDYKINCPTACGAAYPMDAEVTLTAYPELGHTFEGWTGECTGKQITCVVKLTEYKNVTAEFKGPKSKYTLTLGSQGPGSIAIKELGINCKNETCKHQFEEGTTITLIFITEENGKFDEWSGNCIGNKLTCTITFHSNAQVIAKYKEKKTPKILLRINKRTDGKISSLDGKIDCGDICAATYDLNAFIGLKSSEKVRWIGCYYTWNEDCYVKMSEDLVIDTQLNYGDELNVIRKAIDEVFVGPEFDDIPGFKDFLKEIGKPPLQKTEDALRAKQIGTKLENIKTWMEQQKQNWLNDPIVIAGQERFMKKLVPQVLKEVFADEILQNDWLESEFGFETRKPFQQALADLKAKKNGGGRQGLKSWIIENKQWYLENTDMLDYLAFGMARTALLEVFANEIQQFPNLYYYLYNADNPPIHQASKDLREKKGGTGLAGLKNWIQQNKQWYIDNTGIADYLKVPEPLKFPEIIDIVPDNMQITKTAIIKGKNFFNIKQVTLNDVPTRYAIKKVDGTELELLDVKWGISGNPIVVVETNTGWTSARLLNTNQRVIRNANGKTEQCFGGVGKACSGGGPEFFWGSHLVALQVGCDAEVNGKRRCWVVPGSIKHDNCCTLHASGKQCSGPGTDGKPAEEDNHDGSCVAEWDEAKWDVFWRRAWTHDFEVGSYLSDLKPAQSPFNRLPNFEAKESTILCAPSGHELRKIEDAIYCCSGQMDSGKKCT
ncbi:MAG: hypothetical protein Q7S92_01980 [Candidatus Diapherotrites archaeon]|nr:hypothetical protein [Candidatus Diapherotrites archaeon]